MSRQGRRTCAWRGLQAAQPGARELPCHRKVKTADLKSADKEFEQDDDKTRER